MQTQLTVPLSRLIAAKNPRRVKGTRQAHVSLVALIRTFGLLQPLVVRPAEDKPKHYLVIAGSRRLAALREIHKGNGDPKIPCVLREVDAATADGLSLAENFAREQMHPLDEAEAFAKLASTDGKDADAIAAEFGVPERYVRQRMKLSALAKPLKAAFREGTIDTGMAEVFAAVPDERQIEVWQETGGHPRHAEHIRNIIANAWINAQHALFDPATLPPSVVSQDLFGDQILIERQAFMEAQGRALDVQRQALIEDGWREVVLGRREDVQDRLYAMDTPPREFDEPTQKKLEKIATRRQKLEAAAGQIDEGDEARLSRVQAKHESLEAEERQILDSAPEQFSEATKALATVFLILDLDGRAHREHRVPRNRRQPTAGHNGHGEGGDPASQDPPQPPTSDELCDKQLAATFTHQALAVREALLQEPKVRKRILAMILHEKVRSEALAIRHQPNGTSVLASQSETFSSPCAQRLADKRAKLDPFSAQQLALDDVEACEALAKLSDAKIDALIELLIVECLHAHLRRPTALVQHLAEALKVNVREHWCPDTAWLDGFQKIQLAHLVTELKGAVYAPSPDKKKSDLVADLTKLFADAAAGKLEDKALAARVNHWLPSNLRPTPVPKGQ